RGREMRRTRRRSPLRRNSLSQLRLLTASEVPATLAHTFHGCFPSPIGPGRWGMSDSAEFVGWLAQAHAGSADALGRLLEGCRGYLLMIAREELAPDLQAKGGASDLVQETFLDAQRDFARFQGADEAELLAWLRRVLLNNLANFTRRFREAEKRSIAL